MGTIFFIFIGEVFSKVLSLAKIESLVGMLIIFIAQIWWSIF